MNYFKEIIVVIGLHVGYRGIMYQLRFYSFKTWRCNGCMCVILWTKSISIGLSMCASVVIRFSRSGINHVCFQSYSSSEKIMIKTHT